MTGRPQTAGNPTEDRGPCDRCGHPVLTSHHRLVVGEGPNGPQYRHDPCLLSEENWLVHSNGLSIPEHLARKNVSVTAPIKAKTLREKFRLDHQDRTAEMKAELQLIDRQVDKLEAEQLNGEDHQV